MNTGNKGVQQFVAGVRKPLVEHLAPGDAPGFEAITEVLMRLFGVSVRISRGTAGTSFYPEDRSEIVLTVDQIGRTVVHNATSLRRIDAMLRAARIHFVESYDWVLLLPEVRMDLSFPRNLAFHR